MIKKSSIYLIVLGMSIITIGSLFNTDKIVGYLEKETVEVISLNEYMGKDMQEEVQGEGMRVVYHNNNELGEIQIVDNKYIIDTLSVGESISRIYDIYDSANIKEHENYIEVYSGAINHYGIMTEYTQYIMAEDQTIQEIRTGYTAPFVSIPLPNSNTIVQEELQGKWVSDTERVLEFEGNLIKDTYLDNLSDIQIYHIISPTEIIIKRVVNNHIETVKLNIWLGGEELYMFTIDEYGVPILETMEKFKKH